MPKGALAQYLRALFGQKENFTVYFLGKRRSLLHPNTAPWPFFSHYNLFKEKLEEKLARKARVNTERVYRIVLMPPGHPMTHLKSSLFNMAAVSVKRYIHLHFTVRFKSNRVQFFANCALDNIHVPCNWWIIYQKFFFSSSWRRITA